MFRRSQHNADGNHEALLVTNDIVRINDVVIKMSSRRFCWVVAIRVAR